MTIRVFDVFCNSETVAIYDDVDYVFAGTIYFMDGTTERLSQTDDWEEV